ncbi:hypothetical protein, partial [Ethanoligenens sp.]|uniref:hypothetical protein n=1 Tax=Ethanoligenens sp. TaxID=2099655 RepID=UPI0039EB9E75
MMIQLLLLTLETRKVVLWHPNYNPSKSHWRRGENGVKETQEAWKNRESSGNGVRIGHSGKRTVKVYSEKRGHMHGCSVR